MSTMAAPFGIPVACGDCAGALNIVSSGTATPADSRAVLACSRCRTRWLFVAQLARYTPPPEDRP